MTNKNNYSILSLDEVRIITFYSRLGLNELLKGRTSFIIAHRLSTIKNADCIMYVDKGGILERGSHEELLAQKGAYYELYLSQYDFLTRNAEEETTADSPLRLEPALG